MSKPTKTDGREERFVALYEATYADLVRFAQRRVPEVQAEDTVAEAFLAAWRRLDDAPAQLPEARAWLFGIVRNTILNSHRGARRQRAVAVRLAEVPTTTWRPDDAELVARQIDLARAWDRLSAVHQEALALAVIDDLPGREAAAVLGITSVAYRLRLSRARNALRGQLDHRPTSARVTERQPS